MSCPSDQSLPPRQMQQLASYGNAITDYLIGIRQIGDKVRHRGVCIGGLQRKWPTFPVYNYFERVAEFSWLLRIQLRMKEKILSIANGTDRTIAVHLLVRTCLHGFSSQRAAYHGSFYPIRSIVWVANLKAFFFMDLVRPKSA